MKCLKTYEYILSEEEIKKIIADSFNHQQTKHLPITAANVVIEWDKQTYCEPEAKAIIIIEEENGI